MAGHRIYQTSFASVYPHYVAKAEKKGRGKAEVDEIIRWLTGCSQKQLAAVLGTGPTSRISSGTARTPVPQTGEHGHLDKLIDELAKGRKMEKILRQG